MSNLPRFQITRHAYSGQFVLIRVCALVRLIITLSTFRQVSHFLHTASVSLGFLHCICLHEAIDMKRAAARDAQAAEQPPLKMTRRDGAVPETWETKKISLPCVRVTARDQKGRFLQFCPRTPRT